MSRKPHLILVRGGESQLGPISRMGLWNRFPKYSAWQMGLYLGAKILLAGSILFYLLA